MEVDPSVERKVRAPPEQLVGLAPGQSMFKTPGGDATLDVMEGVADVLPPELVKLPWSAYAWVIKNAKRAKTEILLTGLSFQSDNGVWVHNLHPDALHNKDG